MLRHSRQSEQGYSLTEIAIVLGIFGLVMGALWSIAGAMFEQAKREQFSEQMMFIVKNVRSYYQGQVGIAAGETKETTTRKLINVDAFPREMVSADRQYINHPWKQGGTGTVWVQGWPAAGSEAKTKFAVRVEGLAVDACTALVMKEFVGNNAPPGLVEFRINGAALSKPYTPQTVSTQCKATPPVEFIFRLRAPQN